MLEPPTIHAHRIRWFAIPIALAILSTILISPTTALADDLTDYALHHQAAVAQAKLNRGMLAYFEDKGATDAARILTDPNLTKYLAEAKIGDKNSANNPELALKSLDLIDRTIERRATEGLPGLMVTDTLMATSIVNVGWSANHIAHSNQFSDMENLSWSYSVDEDVTPRIWDVEKARFEQHVRNDPSLNAHRHDYDYMYEHYPTIVHGLAGYEQQQQTGHYLNMSDVNRRYVGAGISHLGKTYPYLHTITFADSLTSVCKWNDWNHPLSMGRVMSANQYRADLSNWINNLKTTINEAQQPASDPTSAIPNMVSVRRLYNPNSGLHHYTTSVMEVRSLIDVGWNYEGIAFTQPDKGTPVYRVYNPHNGNHHWTANRTEYDHLIRLGWRGENIAWYQDDTRGTKPVYRAYNPRNGEHLYTVNNNEYQQLAHTGWRLENIAWQSV